MSYLCSPVIPVVTVYAQGCQPFSDVTIASPTHYCRRGGGTNGRAAPLALEEIVCSHTVKCTLNKITLYWHKKCGIDRPSRQQRAPTIRKSSTYARPVKRDQTATPITRINATNFTNIGQGAETPNIHGLA